MTTIGWIGLGHMGNPMVRRLLAANFTVHVYDIFPEAVKNLQEFGAIPTTLPHIAENCDVIITMVQTSQQVTKICLSEDGIFKLAKPNTLYIDCSSIDIAATKRIHEEAVKHQIAMLDAPVSGGVAGAEAGSLTFMVGGSEENFQRAEPILKTMGKKIIHAGADGSGQAAKICNNLILGISMIAVCEGFTLAKKLGLDQKKFFDISSNASGQCWSMTSYCPVPGILSNVPAEHDYQPGFMAKMMLKDLRLAQHAAELHNAVIPLGAVATELYDLFVNQGHGELDFSGIIKMFNEDQTD